MARKKKEASPEVLSAKITLGDIVQEKKSQMKIPVFIGDNNNTVIFINADRDPEDAKKQFLHRLDQYNPAKAKYDEPAIPEQQPPHLKQYYQNRPASINSKPPDDSSNASDFAAFKF